MEEENVLLELRFSPDARDSFDISVTSLKTLDVEVGDKARDPSILAVLTVAAAAAKLITELISLAKELRKKGKSQEILVVKLDEDNKEKSISLLDVSDDEIVRFVSGEK